MFKLINSPAPPDYPAIYKRAIARKLNDIPATPSKDWIKQFVCLAVKGIPIIWGKKINRGFSNGTIPPEETLQEIWSTINYTEILIARLTPRELTRIFPITKTYDGQRYEWKDYYFTMEVIQGMGLDAPIGNRVDDLFFDYQNRHVTMFSAFKMGGCSDLGRYQGQPGIMEEFMEEQGIPPMRMMTDDDGKRFLYDPAKKHHLPCDEKTPTVFESGTGSGPKVNL